MITACTKEEFEQKVKEIFNNDYCLFWKELYDRRGIAQATIFLNMFVEFVINTWWLDIALLAAIASKASNERGLVFCSQKYAAIAVTNLKDSNKTIEALWQENIHVANCLYETIIFGWGELNVEEILKKFNITREEAEKTAQIGLLIQTAALYADAWNLNPNLDELIYSVSDSIITFQEKLKKIDNLLK